VEHYCRISHQHALHCAILEGVGAVVEASFRCPEVEKLHSSGPEDIDDRVEDGHKCLDAEYLQMAVVAGIDKEVVNLEEPRKTVVEK